MSSYESDDFGWFDSSFVKIGFARGTVSVPNDHLIRLDVSLGALHDLSSLPVNDEGLESIGELSQLTGLALGGTKITEDGLVHCRICQTWKT